MSTDARKLACFESLLEEPSIADLDRAVGEEASVLPDPQQSVAIESDVSGAADDSATDVPLGATDADSVGSALTANARTGASDQLDAVAEPMASAAEAPSSPSSSAAVPSVTESIMASAAGAADSAGDLPEAVDATVASSDTLSDAFGREHVANVADEPEERVTATVTNVTRDYTKRLVFQFENGQVWRQQEARRFQYPKDRAFNVVIARGVFGDYQLRVNGEGRMTRIKRLQ